MYQALKEFLRFSESEVRSLASLYSGVVCISCFLKQLAEFDFFSH